MSVKMNCWMFKGCNREPGGSEAARLGECPAATDASFNGLNGGANGGRICWVVAGTFCGGKVQGTSAEKEMSCMTCDFFKTVEAEEGMMNFVMAKPKRHIKS
jgi:hypothetical protein